MQVKLIDPHGLSDTLISTWRHYQDQNSIFSSAYFDPTFSILASKAGRKVRIALIEDGSRTIGFFPFELASRAFGRPVAGALSDFHGIVSDPSALLPAGRLIAEAGLTRWTFDHLVDPIGFFGSHVTDISSSPAIDISSGFKSYFAERSAGTKKLVQIRRKHRQLEADFGGLRYERHSTDKQVLRQVMAWKSEQCIETGTIDYFKFQWIVDFIDRIFFSQTERFSGILSVLYAEETLIAAHMGMRTHNTWHYWFPVYNREFGKYSPGLLLLLKIVEDAAAMGMQRIDLGKGGEHYKSQFANTSLPLLEGNVELPSFFTRALEMVRGYSNTVSASPLIRETKVGSALRRCYRPVRKYLRARRFK